MSLVTNRPIKESGWFKPGRARPYLPIGNYSADVVVIGAGIAGLSAAREARKYARTVIVLEADEVGSGGTGTCTGIVSPMGGYEMDRHAVAEAYGTDVMCEMWSYLRNAARNLRRVVEQEGIKCGLDDSGIVYLCKDPEIAESEYRMHWNEGEPVAMLTGSRLTDKIDTTQYPAALFDNRGFVLDPMALARGLADKAEQEGVEIYEKTPALSIDPKRMRITTSGSVSAGAIIIATNPFTFHFDGIPGTVRRRVVPVYQYVSLMNTTRTPNERTPRSPVRGNYGFWDDQDIDYLFGRGIDYTHFMVSGGNFEFVAGHEPADPRTQDVANMNTLRRTFPGYEFITEKTWGGRIGATTDHVPAMGLIDKNIGVTALADGIPICYESGRTVARALLSKEPVPETFDINRRPRDVRGNLLRSIPVPGKLVDKAGKLLY